MSQKRINGEHLCALAHIKVSPQKLCVIEEELEEFVEFAAVLEAYRGSALQADDVFAFDSCHARQDGEKLQKTDMSLEGYIKVPLVVEAPQ